MPVGQPRRFPPPRDIEEHNRSCFIVRDNNGQALSYVYPETEPGRRTTANLLTRDEARRIAANIARLPELLGAEPKPDANPLIHRTQLEVAQSVAYEPIKSQAAKGCHRMFGGSAVWVQISEPDGGREKREDFGWFLTPQ